MVSGGRTLHPGQALGDLRNRDVLELDLDPVARRAARREFLRARHPPARRLDLRLCVLNGRSSTARGLIARFTATVFAVVAISATCFTATSSPVTSTTGTPYHAATVVLRPPSPIDCR